MGKKLDLTGQKFNHLTVIKEGEPKNIIIRKQVNTSLRLRGGVSVIVGTKI